MLGVGGIIFYEATRRLLLISAAKKLSENISNREEEGIQDNCMSYKILTRPSEGAKWSPGIGAAINDRPFVIMLLIIVALGVFGAVLAYVASYPKTAFLIVSIVFALTLHSGPDNISNNERYLQVIAVQDSDELNGHDFRILTKKFQRLWKLASISADDWDIVCISYFLARLVLVLWIWIHFDCWILFSW
ncbi:MAG: hypothetical protein ACTSSE_02880 [Candidatus Thorarchaeota archaeon]